MYGFIYITTNHIDGKRYIGKKKYDDKERWKSYLGSGIYLKRAIKKYGKDNFSKEIIEECESPELLNQREKFWIRYYDATNSDKYYNIALGGDGLPEKEKAAIETKRLSAVKNAGHSRCGEKSCMSILKESQVKEIIQRLINKEYPSDIAIDYNVSCSTINDIYHHKTWKHLTQDIIFPTLNKRHNTFTKSVVQYDKKGNFIATYKSAREAEKICGVSFKLISQVCRGQKLTAHGFVFRYKGDSFKKYPLEYSRYIKVSQYDKDWNYIQTFHHIKEAEKYIGVNLQYALEKGTLRCGYYWKKEFN